MKSITFFVRHQYADRTIFMNIILISIIILSQSAAACGPYYPVIPTPKFFTSSWEGLTKGDFERMENLRLWQKLTSELIPLDDIEQAVYTDSYGRMVNGLFSTDSREKNLFYVYLNNSCDDEIKDFLYTAKTLEERRAETASPWYYPASRTSGHDSEEYRDILTKCMNYGGTRLKDRYALQAVRALFAARAYEQCVEYYDEAFADFPNTNLFKRMAGRYAAGCWARLGDTDRANEYFAQAGDFASIRTFDPVEFMAERNPDSPDLMAWIQRHAMDEEEMLAVRPVAVKVLEGGHKVRNRGDWHFLLAYIAGEYEGDINTASHHIRKALREKFSSDDLRDHARAYRIRTDAAMGNMETLTKDLLWMEEHVSMISPEAKEWNRMLQNIIYSKAIPALWYRGDYTTAILLCGYADNLMSMHTRYHYGSYEWMKPDCTMSLSEIRASETEMNLYDYGSLSFQLMGSLSSSQLISVKNRMSAATPLYNILRRYARTDADYINELIGTLAIREENYARAMTYLGYVSDSYERTMNIYKGGYLAKDPFYYYPGRWVDYGDWEFEYSVAAPCNRLPDQRKAKYNFAKEMLGLSKAMKSAPTADERALASLRYAIGRRNSMEECWALTQYYRGFVNTKFKAGLGTVYCDEELTAYSFIYDYDRNEGHERTEERFAREISDALGRIHSPEARAEAAYMLNDLRSVIRLYGQTPIAEKLRTSCDDWRSWL